MPFRKLNFRKCLRLCEEVTSPVLLMTSPFAKPAFGPLRFRRPLCAGATRASLNSPCGRCKRSLEAPSAGACATMERLKGPIHSPDSVSAATKCVHTHAAVALCIRRIIECHVVVAFVSNALGTLRTWLVLLPKRKDVVFWEKPLKWTASGAVNCLSREWIVISYGPFPNVCIR